MITPKWYNFHYQTILFETKPRHRAETQHNTFLALMPLHPLNWSQAHYPHYFPLVSFHRRHRPFDRVNTSVGPSRLKPKIIYNLAEGKFYTTKLGKWRHSNLWNRSRFKSFRNILLLANAEQIASTSIVRIVPSDGTSQNEGREC
jgi:hypothetical protein